MSDTVDTSTDTSTVDGTETPAPAPQPVSAAPAPQPAPAPQSESGRRGDGWFRGGVRSGIIAAVVVVVAGAFFTIGWFTSTRGDHERLGIINGINQKMNLGERGRMQGGIYQQGPNQWQGCPNRGRGMMIPQQGQGQGQIVPIPQSQPYVQPQQQGQSPQPAQPSQPQVQPTQPAQPSQQGYLGVGVATVTPQVQQQFGLSRSNGVLITSVDGSGPASKVGIQQGDIVVSINGTTVAQAEEVVRLIGSMKTGDTVSIAIDRQGQSLTVQVTLGGRPSIIG